MNEMNETQFLAPRSPLSGAILGGRYRCVTPHSPFLISALRAEADSAPAHQNQNLRATRIMAVTIHLPSDIEAALARGLDITQ
jgi:hypothetical protein